MGRVRIAAALPVGSVLVAAVIVVTLLVVPDGAAQQTGSQAGASAPAAVDGPTARDAVISAARDLAVALQMRPEELTEPTEPAGQRSGSPVARSSGSESATRTAGPGAAGDRSAGDRSAGPPEDRQQVVAALRELLAALDVEPEELQRAAEAGTGSRAAPAGTADSGGTITISGFAFGPELTVRPGATVRVVNMDTAAHNVSAVDGGFETRTLAQGGSATFTAPATAGRYAFRCTVHPEMTGTLVVAGAPAADRPAGSRSAPTTPPAQQPGAGR